MRVNRSANNLSTDLTELSSSITEGDDFSRADEGEIPNRVSSSKDLYLQGVEEQDDPLSLVVGKLNSLELVTNKGGNFKSRGRGSNSRDSGHRAIRIENSGHVDHVSFLIAEFSGETGKINPWCACLKAKLPPQLDQ